MTFVTRYRDVIRALTDRRLGRAVPPESEDTRAGMPNYDRYVRVNLLEMEGETHARLRRLLGQALSPRQIAELKLRVQEIAEGLVDKVAGGEEIDFIAEVAEPLPV